MRFNTLLNRRLTTIKTLSFVKESYAVFDDKTHISDSYRKQEKEPKQKRYKPDFRSNDRLYHIELLFLWNCLYINIQQFYIKIKKIFFGDKK
jgi:hypothetical protein